jgi:hypothetical protein
MTVDRYIPFSDGSVHAAPAGAKPGDQEQHRWPAALCRTGLEVRRRSRSSTSSSTMCAGKRVAIAVLASPLYLPNYSSNAFALAMPSRAVPASCRARALPPRRTRRYGRLPTISVAMSDATNLSEAFPTVKRDTVGPKKEAKKTACILQFEAIETATKATARHLRRNRHGFVERAAHPQAYRSASLYVGLVGWTPEVAANYATFSVGTTRGRSRDESGKVPPQTCVRDGCPSTLRMWMKQLSGQSSLVAGLSRFLMMPTMSAWSKSRPPKEIDLVSCHHADELEGATGP